MTYKDHVKIKLESEIEKELEQKGYIIETDFCLKLNSEFGVPVFVSKGMLRTRCPTLQKRRLSEHLKRFYGIDRKGCPIVYLPKIDN